MKKKIISTLFISFLYTCMASAQPARHVVLITIDGFRPDFYLDASWGAVNLVQLMKEGTSAKGVNGIFPTVTFPSHTTLITGVKPVTHGINFNNPFEPAGSSGRWYWEFSSIRCPTLWDAVKKAGLVSASVLWPVSVGAPINYNIPDVWSPDSSSASGDRRPLTSEKATPKGLFEEVQQNATGKLEAIDFNMTKDYLAMDENVARMAAYLIRKHAPNFVTVHLPAVDHAEHAQGRDGDQVRRAVAGADYAIRIIIEAIEKAGIKENTAVIITGDHGFVNKQTNISPNTLLSEAGLLGDLKKGDWKAQFHSAGGSAFLYLKDKNDQQTLDKVTSLLGKLPDSQKKLFRIIQKPGLQKAGADTNSVLALAANKGFAFDGSSKGAFLKPTTGGTHGYFPDFPEIQTGFIGYGAGFKKGVVVPVMELVDVAPLIAQLLGLDFKIPGGTVHEGILAK